MFCWLQWYSDILIGVWCIWRAQWYNNILADVWYFVGCSDIVTYLPVYDVYNGCSDIMTCLPVYDVFGRCGDIVSYVSACCSWSHPAKQSSAIQVKITVSLYTPQLSSRISNYSKKLGLGHRFPLNWYSPLAHFSPQDPLYMAKWCNDILTDVWCIW